MLVDSAIILAGQPSRDSPSITRMTTGCTEVRLALAWNCVSGSSLRRCRFPDVVLEEVGKLTWNV